MHLDWGEGGALELEAHHSSRPSSAAPRSVGGEMSSVAASCAMERQ